MNFKRTLQILSKDIEEIEKILGEIDISSPDSRMEMQLALSKLKNLQENFSLFSDLLEEVPVPPPQPPVNTVPPPPDLVTPREAPPATPTVHPSEPPLREETPEPHHEEVPEPQETPEEEVKIPEEKEEISTPVSSKASAGETITGKQDSSRPKSGHGRRTLSDTLHAQHGYRNEQLGKEHTSGDLSSKISKSAVTDLKKIINLNEKFMFIRDLFGGDKERYEETIRIISRAQTRGEVEDLLSAFGWDPESEAARTFREKVERKLKSLQNG